MLKIFRLNQRIQKFEKCNLGVCLTKEATKLCLKKSLSILKVHAYDRLNAFNKTALNTSK